MREPDLLDHLDRRLGAPHARRRLAIEADHEARCTGRKRDFFQRESWYSIHAVIRTALRLTGLHGRARRNAGKVQVRRNTIRAASLPPAFDGFTILQLSDLHADMSEPAMDRMIELLPGLRYDVCALTGDYRGKTFGPFTAAIDGVARVRAHLVGPVYGVVGNHDSIRMVPALERLGIRLLLNEADALVRGDARIHLAGVDDAHFFRGDDLAKASRGIPSGEFALLLTHTPEIYRQAADAGFAALLAGHTHGGQLCLPGGVPLTLDADLPRRLGRGAWRHGAMAGYTSVGVGASIVAVRLNCPPEITLHRLERAEAQ